ncbi:uracil-DNA glycosylase [Rhinoraja longicauda]
MIGQKSIVSYFNTRGKKRSLLEVTENDSKETGGINQEHGDRTPGKRPRSEPGPDEQQQQQQEQQQEPGAAQPGLQLSPQQLSRMEINKQAALHRLTARKAPPGLGLSWRTELLAEFTKPYFTRLMEFVATERKRGTVYPQPHQVFAWSQLCDIGDVKVVILGQDPYHGPSQAHGLCFSVKPPIAPPPSLENMYKELKTDIEGFERPSHGDLTDWAKQGVLLLNAVLTVRAHHANSHRDQGWESFTDAVVSHLNKSRDGLVFMLWGAYAQRKGSVIDRKRHHVLQTVHPSPLSAHRGFFGCKHFSRTNQLLKQAGKSPIDWNLA